MVTDQGERSVVDTTGWEIIKAGKEQRRIGDLSSIWVGYSSCTAPTSSGSSIADTCHLDSRRKG